MKVLKSWGTEGQVVISATPDDLEILESDEPVFIDFDECPVPFFIETLEQKGRRCIVKFEDIDDARHAEELVGRELRSEYDEQEEDASVIGMTVKDADGTTVGTVTDFNDFGGNMCITVEHKGKDILLPFHEDLILEVCDEVITMQIPQGLL